MKNKILTLIISVLCLANVAHAAGVNIYTCKSADEKVVTHLMPKSLKAVVYQETAEGNLHNLACAVGSGDLLLSCQDSEGRSVKLYKDLVATFYYVGRATAMDCHISHT